MTPIQEQHLDKIISLWRDIENRAAKSIGAAEYVKDTRGEFSGLFRFLVNDSLRDMKVLVAAITEELELMEKES